MAKENGTSVRKMEQTLKETKKITGVDLLSIAVNGDEQIKEDVVAEEEEAPNKKADTPVTTAKTPQHQKVDVSNAMTTPKGIPVAQAYLAQRCQPPEPSSLSSSLPTPTSLKKEGKKTLTKAATAENKVITPSTTPPPPVGNAPKATAPPPAEPEKKQKSKHNQHNRVYRDKLKQDKRRYEEHKEKARQYNEKRRKKLRAMAKETGLTMKEMEKTIKEAKIISALTVTASKEAEKFMTPVLNTPHLIGVSPSPHHHAIATNCLDILSDAAFIVLSQSHHQQQQPPPPHQRTTNTHTPSSPIRQPRTVSEDNFDSSMVVKSN